MPQTKSPCPICGEAPAGRYKPFCSKRCADVDLGRWFGERYAIPLQGDDDTPEDADRVPDTDDGQDR